MAEANRSASASEDEELYEEALFSEERKSVLVPDVSIVLSLTKIITKIIIAI